MINLVKRTLPLALATLLLSACSAVTLPARNTRFHVAMVTKSTTTEFWKTVLNGAEAAATEYNMDLSTYGPSDEDDYAAQNTLIEQAVEDGAQVLIVSAIDYEKNALAVAKAAKKVPVVVIDSDVDVPEIATYIGTDNQAAGRQAAQSVLENTAGVLHIGLINFSANTTTGQVREDGAREEFSQADSRAVDITTVTTLSDANAAYRDTLRFLRDHPETNALIAFNEPTSAGAARAVEQLKLQDSVWVVAFDSSTETIDGLQNGSVNALILQSSYAMGYYSVESAYKLASGKKSEVAPYTYTSSRVIDSTNLYAMDKQKALFPFE